MHFGTFLVDAVALAKAVTVVFDARVVIVDNMVVIELDFLTAVVMLLLVVGVKEVVDVLAAVVVMFTVHTHAQNRIDLCPHHRQNLG